MDDQKRDDRYPSNSIYTNIASRKVEDPKPNAKKVQPVAKGKISKQKKGLGEKIAETFLATDFQSVTRHIIFDVLVPAAKDTLYDMVKGSMNMLLFGERGANRNYRDRDRPYTDYTRCRDDRGPRRDGDTRPTPRPYSRNLVDYVTFDERFEAEDVLANLRDLIDQYGVASVKDFYGFAGLPTDYTKDRWGWDNLDDVPIIRENEGYMIRLPRPKVID